MSYLRTMIPVAAFVVINLHATTALAFNWNFCIRYSVHTVDSGVGEDYKVSTSGFDNWPASGVKVRVYDPAMLSWGAYTNADMTGGCFAFTSAANTGFLIDVQSQHTFPGPISVNISTTYPGITRKSWAITANPGGSGGTFTYYVPYGDEANLGAITSWTVPRINGLGGGTIANKFLVVNNLNCSEYSMTCDGSATAGDDIFIAPEYDHSERKFLVGHELGHWLERQWITAGSAPSINYNPLPAETDPECIFVGLGDHGLRSREQATAAYKEGIAHLISALSWNDHNQTDGKFKFYKNQAPHTFETVDLNVAGSFAINWQTSWCSPTIAGRAVEQDWLRHYWNYLTDAGLPKPTFPQITAQINKLYSNGGWTATNVYNQLYMALVTAGQTANQPRWASTAATHGANF